MVVGTLPVSGEQVYLARRGIEPGEGRWSYPGGFLELGEAAQEGARRETEEETQLRVEVGRLIGAYSRPHAGVVTLIYEAQIVGGEPLPGLESTEVRGFGPDEIPWDELAFSTTESALRDWIGIAPRARSAVRAGALGGGRPRPLSRRQGWRSTSPRTGTALPSMAP